MSTVIGVSLLPTQEPPGKIIWPIFFLVDLLSYAGSKANDHNDCFLP